MSTAAGEAARRRAELNTLDAQTDHLVARIEARAKEIERAEREAEARRSSGAPLSRSLWLVAIHEAGHCVQALASARALRGALIYDDGSGAAWVERGPDGADAIAAAGAAASRMAGAGGARPSTADVLTITGDTREVALATFGTEELLAANWSKVEALARALLAYGYIDGSHAANIVGAVRIP
jgi:hypothetical protein